MRTSTLLPLLLLSLTLTASLSSSAATPTLLRETVHDILPKYGLPKGLLPDSVDSYTPVGPDGDFEVELKRPCYVRFSDLVYYEKKIKGKLSYGRITDLKGIQAKKFFVWVAITSIVADESNGTIEFDAGFLSENLPERLFESIPTCKNRACEHHHHRNALPSDEFGASDGIVAEV
ncbi:hypothetical protein QJS04_geneDACA010137 [Acorus gramineus]|uniref:DUF538 family protein n=1 Tax=Acorus gramineus TaxID=55184 RepID=A0AAV9A758_ACOGR|nr:hypothetical protein QJS04_geneDACA010137 [Acorus gramineus]